ncbi:MAG: hypothetical protein KIT27_07315 [Legionellales bacterium]|nr:hypothetical protein [Legionellales bacterium]
MPFGFGKTLREYCSTFAMTCQGTVKGTYRLIQRGVNTTRKYLGSPTTTFLNTLSNFANRYYIHLLTLLFSLQAAGVERGLVDDNQVNNDFWPVRSYYSTGLALFAVNVIEVVIAHISFNMGKNENHRWKQQIIFTLESLAFNPFKRTLKTTVTSFSIENLFRMIIEKLSGNEFNEATHEDVIGMLVSAGVLSLCYVFFTSPQIIAKIFGEESRIYQTLSRMNLFSNDLTYSQELIMEDFYQQVVKEFLKNNSAKDPQIELVTLTDNHETDGVSLSAVTATVVNIENVGSSVSKKAESAPKLTTQQLFEKLESTYSSPHVNDIQKINQRLGQKTHPQGLQAVLTFLLNSGAGESNAMSHVWYLLFVNINGAPNESVYTAMNTSAAGLGVAGSYFIGPRWSEYYLPNALKFIDFVLGGMVCFYNGGQAIHNGRWATGPQDRGFDNVEKTLLPILFLLSTYNVNQQAKLSRHKIRVHQALLGINVTHNKIYTEGELVRLMTSGNSNNSSSSLSRGNSGSNSDLSNNGVNITSPTSSPLRVFANNDDDSKEDIGATKVGDLNIYQTNTV